MNLQTVVCRFNGIDKQLVDELAFAACMQPTEVTQAHPASIDKKTLRVVTVVKFACESPEAADVVVSAFEPIAGVEVFLQ